MAMCKSQSGLWTIGSARQCGNPGQHIQGRPITHQRAFKSLAIWIALAGLTIGHA